MLCGTWTIYGDAADSAPVSSEFRRVSSLRTGPGSRSHKVEGIPFMEQSLITYVALTPCLGEGRCDSGAFGNIKSLFDHEICMVDAMLGAEM